MECLHCILYRMCGYLRLVQEVAGKSMQEVVDEVRTLPVYAAREEVSEYHVITSMLVTCICYDGRQVRLNLQCLLHYHSLSFGKVAFYFMSGV